MMMLRKKQPMKTAKICPSEPLASQVVTTTTAAMNLPIRRVSDPDIITPETRQQILVSNGDVSIASSAPSSSESSSSDDDTSSVQSDEVSGQFDDASDDNSSACEELTDAKRSVSFADDSQGSSSKTNTTPLTFEDLFQRWQTNRVVKRRYPAVKAFPALKPFEGFDESNTAQGYSFGPYFDRWYAKQQERSQDLSSSSSKPPAAPKRPLSSTDVASCDTDVDSDTSPRSAKKIKLHGFCTSSSIQQQRNLNSLHKWNAANALYRSKIVELPDSFVPGPYTVIMGRRLKAPGCVHLRNMTDQYAKEYKESDSMQKSRIVTVILRRIYAKAPVGAFVRCKAGQYFEVEDLIAREKIVSELIAGGLQLC